MKVNDLIFLADFYVLDMQNDDQTALILLGRSFLKTFKATIDIHNGSLIMEFNGKIVKFNIYNSIQNPSDDNQVYSIDAIDYFAPKFFELDRKDELEVTISK